MSFWVPFGRETPLERLSSLGTFFEVHNQDVSIFGRTHILVHAFEEGQRDDKRGTLDCHETRFDQLMNLVLAVMDPSCADD